MYSNDQTQIRNGLINYIGSLLNSSCFDGKAAKQNVVSILIEEAMKLSQNEDGKFDMYALKPLLRGTNVLLEQRINELSKLPKNISVKPIEDYNFIKDKLNKIISEIN